ncbi:hypothetical protein MTR67_042462 [Solanum verrucosum]|uniref:Pentatricopeptide repeat-containing protein n=1 Tax=Solanum verrucosum TaxID=315347 RepID=A0AAF0UMV9_SOLVR|nr:hypothetical protein MTR67_042462 [Solanum verrucosum]
MDVVAWSSLISAYTFQGKARTALNIFEQMEKANVSLDGITSLGILKACSHAGLPDEAQNVGRLHQAYDVIRKMPVKVTAKAWGLAFVF